MSSRISFADLLKAGADKDEQRVNLKLAPSSPLPPPSKSVAPDRDFNKRANSLERDALPKGLLPGASKAIYDALYLRTLGAIDPTSMIQATRKQIIDWSGVKNVKTVNAHLKKLEENGLIKRSNFNGEPTGNYYEICLPIEPNLTVKTIKTNPDQTQTRPRPDPDQTRTENWSGSGLGNRVENKGLSRFPLKTKNKTKSDDEPAALYRSDNKFDFQEVDLRAGGSGKGGQEARLSDARLGVLEKVVNFVSKKLIGKELTPDDDEKLKELAELLMMELEIAAARTDSISNVPAFLTEHLRRRLSEKPDAQTSNKTLDSRQTSKDSPADKSARTVQTVIETYQAEPLTANARETVLKTMREYVEKGQSEFVTSLRDTYTTDDWNWLSKHLFE